MARPVDAPERRRAPGSGAAMSEPTKGTTVHVCLNCERYDDDPFTCEPDDDSNCRGRSVPMSLLAWEIRNVEAALLGWRCTFTHNGKTCLQRRSKGYVCIACSALRSVRVCMDEIAKKEPLPRAKASLRRRAS